MRIGIGIRTIKTAAGVSISVILAQFMQLSYYSSAGILTLLSIQRTRRQSVRTVTDRFFACMTGLAVASVCFSLSDFQPWIFPLVFLICIPLCVLFKIQGGVPSSSVVIMHTYIHNEVSMAFLLNELGIVTIGLGVGLLVNLYMPSIDRRIARSKQEIERHVSVILSHFAKHLREGNEAWDGREMLQLDDMLKEARALAKQDVENHFTRKEHYHFDYFENMSAQFRILQRMLPLVSRVDIKLEQGRRIGEWIDDLSEDILHMNDTSGYIERLNEIRSYHKELPLPTTRAEFEGRACLYHLANELGLLIETINENPGK